MKMNRDELLRGGLAANAAFSWAMGGLLATIPARVGDLLGVEIDGWIRLLGVALLAHGVLLAVVARSALPAPLARLNLLMIAPYPIVTIALVVSGLVDRGIGQMLVLADGAVVGLFALAQAYGLRTLTKVPDPQLV